MTSIALYPGSFKPPHAAHVHAIRFLLSEARVSKVVVIVSNRCRPIPGTDLVIDAALAVRLFDRMLRQSSLPLDRIELVIAPHRATTEAIGYIRRVAPETSLLFCVGKRDFDSADNRFAEIHSLAARHDVFARVQVLPIPPDDVHSSFLRQQLARSQGGLENYGYCLPAEMSQRDKFDLWTDCRDRLKPIVDVVRPKIERYLRGHYDTSNGLLTQDSSSTIDPVFEFRGPNNAILVVKYAGDTTSEGLFGDRFVQKPARRLAVEKRATRYLSTCLERTIFSTRVDLFDREHRVLVVSGRPTGSRTVSSQLSSGEFAKTTARKAAEVLAKIHSSPIRERGFWGDTNADQAHWHTVVSAFESRAFRVVEKAGHKGFQHNIVRTNRCVARPIVMHMSFTPDNLWCRRGNMTFENLECAGIFGDPAFDVASLVSAYVLAGLKQDSMGDCLAAIEEFETAYRNFCNNHELGFSARVAGYSVCQMLAAQASAKKRKNIDALLSIALDLAKQCDRKNSRSDLPTVATMLGQTRA